MPDNTVGGPGSRPIPNVTAQRDNTNVVTPGSEVPGQVTNQSWVRGSGTPAPDQNRTDFEQRTRAPSVAGIAGQFVSAGLRMLVGKLKEVPVLGNILNAADAAIDATKLVGMLVTGKGTTQERVKVASDLAAHTIGIFRRNVGADYDKGQAAMRLMIASGEVVSKVTGMEIPPSLRDWYPVMAAGYGSLRGYTPRNEDGSERQLIPGGVFTAYGASAGAAFVLPRLGNLFGGGDSSNQNRDRQQLIEGGNR